MPTWQGWQGEPKRSRRLDRHKPIDHPQVDTVGETARRTNPDDQRTRFRHSTGRPHPSDSGPTQEEGPDTEAGTGSVVEELQTMRELIERQGLDAKVREDAFAAELHDLRGQLHQTELRLAEALRALPAPRAERAGILARWFKGKE